MDTWAVKFLEHNTPKEEKTPKHVSDMVVHIKEFFKDKLSWLREQCKEIIPSVDNNLVSSCLKYTSILFDQLKAD